MIRKYLLGGPSIFAQYVPFTAASATLPDVAVPDTSIPTSKAASSTSADKGKATEKDLLNMVGRLDGLPSDMSNVISSVQKLMRLEAIDGDGDLTSTYLKALLQVKTATFFKKEYDKARENVLANKGLNEFAITDLGKVVVINKEGKIGTKTLEEARNNQGDFLLLTNADLLNLRANDNNHAYDQSILLVVNNGIGLEKINTLIKEAMHKLGSTSVSAEGYTKKENEQITKGIEFLNSNEVSLALQSGMSLNGLYKNKIASKDLIDAAKKAISYIYTVLPENAKSILKLHAGSAEGAKDLIVNYVSSEMDFLKDFSVNLELDENGEKPGTKSKQSELNEKANLLTDISKGNSGTAGTFTLKDEEGRTFNMNGVLYPDLSVNPNNPLTEGTIKDLLTEGKYHAAYKSGDYAITFGNLELSDVDMENITFLNDGKAIRTILPVIRNEEGHLVPDLEFMKNNQEIINLINSKEGNFKDPEVKVAMMEAGIISPITGLPDMTRFLSFLCINGLGTSRNIKNNEFATEITGDTLNLRILLFENGIYKLKKDNGGKTFNFNYDHFNALNPFDLFDNYDKLYEGTIFIPLTENTNQTLRATLTNMDKDIIDLNEFAYNSGRMRILSNTLSTSSSLLDL